MKEWNTYKLKDICLKITDGSHFSPAACVDGYPMFSVKDMEEYGFNYSSCKRISAEDFNTLKANDCIPQKGDVLVAKDGSFLKQIFVCNETREEAILSSIAIFRPNPEYVIPEFLCYILKSPKVYNYIAQNCVSGSALPRIVLKAFKDVEVSIPSIDIQKWIISKLTPIDQKIQLNRQINDNLEQQAQALYKSWFVDFEPFKDGKFVESDSGMIPKGWRVGNLLDVAELYDSKRKPLSSIQRSAMKKIYPYYGATSIMDYVDNYIFDGIYLLMGEDGSVVTDEGYPFLQYVSGKFWPNNHAHVMQGKNGYTTEMLHCFLLKKNISEIVTGAVQAKISQGNMKKISLIIAPDAIMNEFTKILDGIYAKIRCVSSENLKLEIMRDSLLPKLMSGELKINEIDC